MALRAVAGFGGTLQDNAIGVTSTDGLVLQNTTAAAAGAQQFSPRVRWTGQGWKTAATAASEETDWIAEVQPVQGSSAPSANLVFSSQINAGGYTGNIFFSSGSATVTGAGCFLDSTGTIKISAGTGFGAIAGGVNNLFLGGSGNYPVAVVENGALGLVAAADRLLGWSSSNTSTSGLTSGDTGLSRAAAGKVAIGNGTVGDASGTLNAAFLENSARGALSGTTGTQTLNVTTNNVFSLTPTGAMTINTTGTLPAGANYYLIITTSGTSSFVLTFGTGFKVTGTLTTGTVSAKVFVMCFVSDGTNLNEVSRTTAM